MDGSIVDKPDCIVTSYNYWMSHYTHTNRNAEATVALSESYGGTARVNVVFVVLMEIQLRYSSKSVNFCLKFVIPCALYYTS